MQLIVTTGIHPTEATAQLAESMAKTLQVPYVRRGKQSLDFLKASHRAELLVVVKKQGPVVITPGGEYFFHLSMAELRINNLKNGKPDHMVEAMGLSAGMSVLDCTLGLATDAIVASFVAGAAGQVTGIEHALLISQITEYGLRHFSAGDEAVTMALRRIQVVWADYYEYLCHVPDKSFDIVYFDPMFRHPIHSSSNLKPLRYLADDRPLLPDAVQEACRIARQRVVIKETRNSAEFDKFALSGLYGGKYSSVHYGVIQVNG